MMAARYGIARGLFSNESGLGSAPIVAAAAQTRNPVRQALVSSTGTFWDTVVICALTGLVLVSSILAYPDIDYTSDAALTKMAFAKIPYVGTPILSFGIVTFAFSTILGWTYYSQKAVEYLGGRKIMRAYRLLWIVMVYVGSVVNLSVELRRCGQCPHGHSEPYLPASALGRHRQRNPEVSLERPPE